MPFSLYIKIWLILIKYNLIFQTIVEEICGEISPQNTVNMAIKKPIKKLKKFLDYECKEKLSVQLCGLLRSGVHCLKGGQSLQYTSLLLINKIIDTLIIYDISRFPHRTQWDPGVCQGQGQGVQSEAQGGQRNGCRKEIASNNNTNAFYSELW